jgi:hypothetical protein
MWTGYCNKKVTEVLDGPGAKEILDGGHVLVTFLVGGAVLTAQLLLQQWPPNFFGFCLLSPLLAVGILTVLTMTAWPKLQSSLPVLAGGLLLVLTAWQTVLGALYHQLPIGNNRAIYTLVNSLTVTLAMYLASREYVPKKLKRALVAAARQQSVQAEVVHDEEADEDASVVTAEED